MMADAVNALSHPDWEKLNMSDATKKRLWAGLDLGGTKMLAKAYNAKFEELGRKRVKTAAQEGAKAGLQRIGDTIETALEKADKDTESLAGIGVGCPGPIDLEKGVLIEAANLGWTKVKIRDALQERFNCPVYLLNDVDAGVYGEYRFGAGKGAHCVKGIFTGTGVGGGCVYDGKIILSKNGTCMEVGHVQVDPDGPLCGCGRYGCLEAVSSRLAISAAVAQAAYRGQAPHLLETAGTDIAQIRSGVLASSIKNGDKVVEQIIRDAARNIGLAVAGIVNLLAPDVIVLGGGLVEAMPDLFVEEVRTAARGRVMDSYVDAFTVAAAELADDAGVLGCAAWAEKNVGG